MSKETVSTLAYKCNDCDRYPRYAKGVGCWNDDYVCNCPNTSSMSIHGRLVHRTHMGRYVDHYGLPKRRATDDPEVADPLPPTDDDGRYPLL